LVALQPSFHVGQLLRFAAAPIEQPYLIASRLARTRRGEREVLAVRTPLRRRLAVLARRHLMIVRAVVADRPDVRVGLVFLDVDLRDDIGDLAAVRRTLRIADVGETLNVV